MFLKHTKFLQLKLEIEDSAIRGVIYEIPRSRGKTYVGETKRSILARIREHENCVAKGDTNNGISKDIFF